MTPWRDSEDWLKTVGAIARLEERTNALDERIKASDKKEDERHGENGRRFERIEGDLKGVKDDINELKGIIIDAKGVLNGLKRAAQILAWVVGVGISIMTLFGPTIRTHLHLPNASLHETPTISQRTHEQFNAHNPIL